MGLKGRLQRLQKTARGRLAWLDLSDGSSFYYDPTQTAIELFLYAAQSIQAVRVGEELPPTPKILKVVGGLPSPEAREKAFWQLYGVGSKPFISFDLGRFFDAGEIKPHPAYKRKPEDPPPDEGGDVVLIPEPRKI